MNESARFLDLAARAAWRGMGHVEPNPMVGCVIARDGRVIGIGHHRRFGGPHAEVEALADCARRGLDPRGATMYVTLEPCAHWGKTPPCVDAIVRAGIARVVAARLDPTPVSGGGGASLGRSGVGFELDDSSEAALRVGDPFVKRVTTGLPWVIAKWAQTIDGRVATSTGESRWISAPASRRRVHRLRARVDAIIVGAGTVKADDPMLNARGVRVRRIASRVVVDSELSMPLECNLVATASQIPTIVACAGEGLDESLASKRAMLVNAGVRLAPERIRPGEVDLRAMLADLSRREGFTCVLVEGGPTLLGTMIDQGLIDEAVVHVAPMILGDEFATPAAIGRHAPRLDLARRFTLVAARRVGGDAELIYRSGRAGQKASPA